jgi:uracil-DNA glycosylase
MTTSSRPLWIVGQAPGERAKGEGAFDGPGSGHRLADLMGLSPDDLLRLTTRVNLLDDFPGKAGRGDRFPIREARAGARKLLREIPREADVLLAGGNVARAFGLRGHGWLVWEQGAPGRRHAVVPHPSGINRWWNEPANEARARVFLMSVAAETFHMGTDDAPLA